jgi:penicillin-binding protein 1A
VVGADQVGGFVTAVWIGRDDNSPMKRVTGGGVPASIWHTFMASALPRLNVAAIPGGDAPGPPPSGGEDMIGDLLARAGIDPNATDAEGGPPPVQPQPQPPPAVAQQPPSPEDLY